MDKIPTFAAMLRYCKANTSTLVFSKWNRKSYAIFASLHKVVIIAQLSVDICSASLLKNPAVISMLNWFSGKEEKNCDIVVDDQQEKQQNQLLLMTVATNCEIAYGKRIIVSYNNGKPIFCTVQNMGFSFKKSEYD